jgi:hypothetical protein
MVFKEVHACGFPAAEGAHEVTSEFARQAMDSIAEPSCRHADWMWPPDHLYANVARAAGRAMLSRTALTRSPFR